MKNGHLRTSGQPPLGTNVDREGLLARLENLEVVVAQARPEVERAPDLATTLRTLAEQIAEVVANRLAEDLLSLPAAEDEPGRRKRG